MTYRVAALYKFVTVEDVETLRESLLDAGTDLGMSGTLLVAPEGLNGTIAGRPDALDRMIATIRADERFSDLDVKYSETDENPFLRFKVRLKKEIVTMGQPGVDPNNRVGTYVSPDDWNAVIEDGGTVVIDTRNDYEVGVGTFKGALNPETDSFRDFPAWVEKNREALEGKRIAMFCTGGIRCEKASSYMLGEGFDEVLHLKGGILKYLETQPASESLWQGDCFVFDGRVAVGHGVTDTDWAQCFACRHPITPEQMASDAYVEGVSCPKCIDMDDAKRSRFRERQRQMELARDRGETHIGRKA